MPGRSLRAPECVTLGPRGPRAGGIVARKFALKLQRRAGRAAQQRAREGAEDLIAGGGMV